MPRETGSRSPRWRALAVVAAVLLASTAACSGDGGAGDGAPPGAVGSEGVLRLGVSGLTSLDPAAVDGVSIGAGVVLDALFDGLTRIDRETGDATGELAASWAVSEDGTIWTFELAERRFADGAPIRAEDVAASLNRARDEDLGGPAATGLEPVIAVEAVGESTVEVRLDEPFGDLPTALSAPEYAVMPAAEARKPPAIPTGSGPFGRVSGRDDGWRLEPTPGRAVRLEAVEVRRFEDDGASLAAFRDGSVDWTAVPRPTAPEADGATRTPALAQLWLGFNLADPTLEDADLRRAVTLAINRPRSVAAAYGAEGVAEPTTGLTPILPGSEPTCGGLCDHDPAAARRLLDGATPRLSLAAYDEEPIRLLAAELAGDLRDVGIEVDLLVLPIEEYEELLMAGEAGLFLYGSVASAPSPDPFLASEFLTAGPENPTGFSDAAVDAAIRRARSAGGAEERRAAYLEAEETILASAAAVPLVEYRAVTLASPSVSGLEPGFRGLFDVGRVHLVTP